MGREQMEMKNQDKQPAEDASPGELAEFRLELSPSHLLHRAQQLASNRSAAALRAAGVTLRQFSVLAAIAAEEGVSQSRLVEITGVDRSTLADMMQRMEAAGLVGRSRSSEDARAMAVNLTPAGLAAIKIAAPAVAEADLALLASLPRNRRGPFLDLLTGLIRAEVPGSAKPSSRETGKKEKASKDKKKLKSKDKPRAKAKSKDRKKGGKK